MRGEVDRMKDRFRGYMNPDLYPEETVKVASNVGFACVVFTVLVFTVIAVTYRIPTDPLFHSTKSFTDTILEKPQNATFVPDESVVITAEDTPLAAPDDLPPAINASFVEQEVEQTLNNSAECDTREAINCSAPGVLFAIESTNLIQFPTLDFYSYRTPVRGSNDHECDVAWTYRSSKDGSPRRFRDFRRYSLIQMDTCDYLVDKIGVWHSGLNARPSLLNPNLFPGAESPADLEIEKGVDEIDDEILSVNETSFSVGKYLYYQRAGDYCKGMNQYMWSLLCALGEAKYLNRTFVMDLEVCLSNSSNPGHADEPGKDFRFYYDYEHLRESLSIIEEKQFLQDWATWDSEHPTQKIVAKQVDYKSTPMQLRDDRSTAVLKRVFNDPEPSNDYWFRVCEGEAETAFQRPWGAVWKSKRINEIVGAIGGRLGWDYDAVHVVRGEKINHQDQWPNLDADTSPDALIKTLDKKLSEGRNLYIATNEQYDHYFDKLKAKWRTFQLDDFKDLWAVGSNWYNETMELNGDKPVEFDGYMRIEVDSEVLFKARNRVETFNDLTKDCKNGIEACS